MTWHSNIQIEFSGEEFYESVLEYLYFYEKAVVAQTYECGYHFATNADTPTNVYSTSFEQMLIDHLAF